MQLGQEDGFKRCECLKCDALDQYRDYELKPGYTSYYEQLKDYPCERLLGLHKWIADECMKSHPNKTVHLLVYGPALMPSRKFKKWPPNVVGEMCTLDPETIGLWKGKVQAMTNYIYNFDITLHGGLCVRESPESIATVYRDLHDANFIGVATCIGGYNWGLEGPVYYVGAKILGNPNLGVKALVKEYCDGLYGNASQAMQDFFDLLYTRAGIVKLTGDEQDRILYRYQPFFLEQLERFLVKAERNAESERPRLWVKLTREYVDYLKSLVRVLTAYRSYQADPNETTWATVRGAVQAFDDWRMKAISYDASYADRWFPAYSYFCNFLTGRGSNAAYYSSWWGRKEKALKEGIRGSSVGYGAGSQIRVPFVLDLNRQPIVAPVVARRAASAPKIDGDLSDPVWKSAAPGSLHDMAAQGTDIATTFRVLYDEGYLYVAWDCEEPEPPKMRRTETGRDGPAYNQDCVELFLDWEGTSRRYYHFIAAAQKNTFYDERCGFAGIDAWDDKWNPQWDYAFAVEEAGKRWTMEMRVLFKELGTTSPSPGTEWYGNFGRERYVGVGLFEPGIFIWSQNEEAGLNTPKNFGRLKFE